MGEEIVKKQKAVLIDKNTNLIEAEFELGVGNLHLEGDVRTIASWVDNEPHDRVFFTNVMVKWDGCSHFKFYGEDFSPSMEEDNQVQDSYYHICGTNGYIHFMRLMTFIYMVSATILGDKFDEKDELVKLEKFNLLEGYKIDFVEEEE